MRVLRHAAIIGLPTVVESAMRRDQSIWYLGCLGLGPTVLIAPQRVTKSNTRMKHIGQFLTPPPITILHDIKIAAHL